MNKEEGLGENNHDRGAQQFKKNKIAETLHRVLLDIPDTNILSF